MGSDAAHPLSAAQPPILPSSHPPTSSEWPGLNWRRPRSDSPLGRLTAETPETGTESDHAPAQHLITIPATPRQLPSALCARCAPIPPSRDDAPCPAAVVDAWPAAAATAAHGVCEPCTLRALMATRRSCRCCTASTPSAATATTARGWRGRREEKATGTTGTKRRSCSHSHTHTHPQLTHTLTHTLTCTRTRTTSCTATAAAIPLLCLCRLSSSQSAAPPLSVVAGSDGCSAGRFPRLV